MSLSTLNVERRVTKRTADLSALVEAPPRGRPTTYPGSRTGLRMRVTFLLADLLAIASSVGLAIVASNVLHGLAWTAVSGQQFKLFGLLAAGLLVVAASSRTYSPIPPRPVRQFRGWVLGSLAICTALVLVGWLFDLATGAEITAVVVAALLSILSASFNRAMCRVLFGKKRWWGTRLIVVGDGSLASETFLELNREPQWGLRPVGFVADDPPLAFANELGYLGPLDQLDQLAEEFDVDRALVSVHTFESDNLVDLLGRAYGPIRHWIIVPSLDRFPSMWLHECETARLPAMSVTNRLALPWSFALKRAFDLAIVICILPIMVPLLLAIGLLVRLSSKGPIFYGQSRVGRKGRGFKAWKFRTMIPDADRVLLKYLEDHPEAGAEWAATHKLKRDPRITWVGRWLRILSLDELPQIWNVLVADMSLVGPRPIVAAEIDKYADRYYQYMQVMPGVTGLWQVSGRNNTTYKERVDLDAYYVQNWSVWLDMYILACTVKVVLLGEGAY